MSVRANQAFHPPLAQSSDCSDKEIRPLNMQISMISTYEDRGDRQSNLFIYFSITRMNTSEGLINMPLVYFKCNFKAQFAWGELQWHFYSFSRRLVCWYSSHISIYCSAFFLVSQSGVSHCFSPAYHWEECDWLLEEKSATFFGFCLAWARTESWWLSGANCEFAILKVVNLQFGGHQ